MNKDQTNEVSVLQNKVQYFPDDETKTLLLGYVDLMCLLHVYQKNKKIHMVVVSQNDVSKEYSHVINESFNVNHDLLAMFYYPKYCDYQFVKKWHDIGIVLQYAEYESDIKNLSENFKKMENKMHTYSVI